VGDELVAQIESFAFAHELLQIQRASSRITNVSYTRAEGISLPRRSKDEIQ